MIIPRGHVHMMISWLKVVGVITIIFIPNKKMTKYKKKTKKNM